MFTFLRSKYGKFILSEKATSITHAFSGCMSPGGNIFVAAASSGGSAWIYDPSQS